MNQISLITERPPLPPVLARGVTIYLSIFFRFLISGCPQQKTNGQGAVN